MQDLTLKLREDLETARGLQGLFVENSDAYRFLDEQIDELLVRLALSEARDAELEAAMLR